ncbi:MAG: FAD-dependent thymidylate synthase [Alphaproteobacteria bacterium]|nr:FAD-dependent thymidylate synthase [Alphaproteobacteria bacterium]
MKVALKAKTDLSVTALASHAARVCYSINPETINQPIDVKTRLFDPGHHTTLQHNYFTFFVEDIPVSAVAFGLHLASPHYNSDQRSGRYSKMYNEPDFNALRSSLLSFYPSAPADKIMSWVEKGVRIYQENISCLTELATEKIKQERPFVNGKYITQNAPKIAQEQLRVFISQLAPTALDFTVNLSALTALYRVAWSPEMRLATKQMADLVITENPDLSYMFNSEKQTTKWAPEILSGQASVVLEPTAKVLNVIGDENAVSTTPLTDSLDTLPFAPTTMTNSQFLIQSEVVCSCATFGQDQRHRSLKRSAPAFTGAFYVPPLVAEAGLSETAQAYMQEWLDLAKEYGRDVATLIAPYGAMVKYQKVGDLNALVHEQAKRTCWCAQEEIYHLACGLRSGLKEKLKNPDILARFAPPCMARGLCQEGVRFCGRDIKARENYFSKRRI